LKKNGKKVHEKDKDNEKDMKNKANREAEVRE
jgi:hypothetical protein